MRTRLALRTRSKAMTSCARTLRSSGASLAPAGAALAGVLRCAGDRRPWRRRTWRIGRPCRTRAAQVREDGVTYNVYAQDGEAVNDWPLELLPFLIDADEWNAIERGVVQRARLLNATLADVYGAQACCARPAAAFAGVCPPAVPAPGARRGAGRRRAPARGGVRPRARARRALVGVGAAHAGAVGAGLCAGEPPRRRAAVPRRLSPSCACSASRRPSGALLEAPCARSARPASARASCC